ncbi:MAG: phosphoribosylaminoimidazolesuccinocarboxamide synthase, partial [Actinomycetota bacterium]
MGSVKDLTVIEPATPNQMGRGRFFFSDRYSVFDWGEMPDQIPHKGESIALLGAYFFERLEDMGIPTHYLGLIEDDEPKRLEQLQGPSAIMEVQLLNVIEPGVRDDGYDYTDFKEAHGCFLIPLE